VVAIKALLTTLLVSAATFAPVAHAGSGDDDYLAELSRRHVDVSSPNAAVKVGHAVCLTLG
jgi:hypothetical protein